MKGTSAPELIITGRIATLAGTAGFGWVDAIAVQDGRVTASGSTTDVQRLAGAATRWLRLDPGEVVLPGTTDAHLHLAEAALGATRLDLSRIPTRPEALRAIAATHGARLHRGDADGWITGAGWSVDRWGSWPTIDDLESSAPGRPVALWSHDHHSRWVSRVALERAGVGSGTPDPPGGVIGRTEGGTLTGILHERAATLVDGAIPRPSAAETDAAVVDYGQMLLGLGITGAHDPGGLAVSGELRDGPMLFRRLALAGRLPLRVHGSIRSVELERAAELGLRSGVGVTARELGALDQAARRIGERYRMGWLKLFADGSMGSRTAALLAPYEADPGMERPAGGAAGMVVASAEELAADTARAARIGIATQIHAIGDGAVRSVLGVLERAARPAGVPLMSRIEHVQLMALEDAPRFARSAIATSVQPVHLRSDARAARRLWGARTVGAFALRTLLDTGAVVAFGTDAPVEPPDPWPGLAIAVTRTDPEWPDGEGPFHPEQSIGLVDAVRAACVGPSVLAGDTLTGRLVPGSPADLIVLPSEVVEQPVRTGGALGSARPLATLLDGRIVHRAPGWDREPGGPARPGTSVAPLPADP